MCNVQCAVINIHIQLITERKFLQLLDIKAKRGEPFTYQKNELHVNKYI